MLSYNGVKKGSCFLNDPESSPQDLVAKGPCMNLLLGVKYSTSVRGLTLENGKFILTLLGLHYP